MYWMVDMETLSINNVRKEFGMLVAVNDVSFRLERGQVLGLIGPNGAGKTTLLRILATVLRPTSGSVQVLGYDSAKQYLHIRKHVGYLPDFFNLYNDLTLRECLDFFARAYRATGPFTDWLNHGALTSGSTAPMSWRMVSACIFELITL